MVLKRVSLNPAVKYFGVVTPSRFAAKVEDLIVITVALIQKALDFEARVSVQVLQARRGETMDDYTGGQVCQIEIKAVLDKSPFFPRHSMPTRLEKEIARQATSQTAPNLGYII